VHLRADKPREAALEWSTEHGWRNASSALDEHTVIDPAKQSKPVFQWRVGDNKAIVLPLLNDRLDVAAAKLPAGSYVATRIDRKTLLRQHRASDGARRQRRDAGRPVRLRQRRVTER